jgi:hypothetical protein
MKMSKLCLWLYLILSVLGVMHIQADYEAGAFRTLLLAIAHLLLSGLYYIGECIKETNKRINQ